MTALHSGRCDMTATLAIQGAEAIERQKRIDLPGVISLRHGMRLLDEEVYAKVSAAKSGAAKQLPSRTLEPDTVRIDAIKSTDEGSGPRPT